MTTRTTEWSSRLTFIMATAGAAVGLGNIWRFPYIVGENGGGAFVLVYLLCVILLGIPLMMSEVLIGRRGQANPASAMKILALQSGKSAHWRIAGAIPVLAGFLILSFYSVVAGWVLHYIYLSASDSFKAITSTNAQQIYLQLLANPWHMLLLNTIVLAATGTVIILGIEKGIEKTVYVMFPALIFLVLMLLFYAESAGSLVKAMDFLFKPDLHELTGKSVLLALGQAFFSLSVGTGITLMYGAYLPKQDSIASNIIIIAIIDTAIALLAGLVIFPIVFAHGLAPSEGPGLIFKTLPIAFGKMPFGAFFALLFFIMLEIAAFTSAIGLLEPAVVWLMENFNWSRKTATVSACIVLWILGLGTIASFNMSSEYKFLGHTFFSFVDYLTSNIMLPLGGFLVAIFTGWIMHKSETTDELELPHHHLAYRCWRIAVRYIAPIAILIIFLSSLGIFNKVY